MHGAAFLYHRDTDRPRQKVSLHTGFKIYTKPCADVSCKGVLNKWKLALPYRLCWPKRAFAGGSIRRKRSILPGGSCRWPG